MYNPYQYYADTYRLYSPYLAMGWKWYNPTLNLGDITNLYTVPYGVPVYETPPEVIENASEKQDKENDMMDYINMISSQFLCIIILIFIILFIK